MMPRPALERLREALTYEAIWNLLPEECRKGASSWQPGEPTCIWPLLASKIRDRFMALAEAALLRETPGEAETPNLRALPHDTFMDVYVPGVWRCPLCQFELMRTALFVTTGEAGVSNDMAFDSEPCPNDGTMLVPVTWKERAESNMRWGSELMERLIAATRTEHLPGALEQLDRWAAAPPPSDAPPPTEERDR